MLDGRSDKLDATGNAEDGKAEELIIFDGVVVVVVVVVAEIFEKVFESESSDREEIFVGRIERVGVAEMVGIMWGEREGEGEDRIEDREDRNEGGKT